MVLGLGSWELALVGLALLALFGPEHVPRVMRKAGQMQGRVQRAFTQLEQAVEEEERKAQESLEVDPEDDDEAEERP